eukprot:NODE_14_length_51535_cov_1.125049.p25 type:complete len:297 gc:universal NODE_14_length_51535_cov_1.125049:49541-50431(+)
MDNLKTSLFSFHGCHSGSFCMHAKDTLEEIVAEAYRKGGTHLGLTEHCPRLRDKDLYPEEIGKLYLLDQNFANYHNSAVRLRELYKDRMEILIGFECEYISDCDGYLDFVLNLKKKYNFDYFVGSIHHVKGIPIDINIENYQKAIEECGSEEQVNLAYYDEQLEMLQKLKPVTVGHFDVIRLFKSDKNEFRPAVWEKILRNIEFIAHYGGIVEINTKAYKKGLEYPYPHPKIVAEMLKLNIKFTLADDSHSVSEVFQFYDRVFKFCVENSILHLYYLDAKLVVKSCTVNDLMKIKL